MEGSQSAKGLDQLQEDAGVQSAPRERFSCVEEMKPLKRKADTSLRD